MAVSYTKASPYYITKINTFYLDVLNYRRIPLSADDPETIINDVYEFRPDLMASDLYGDSGLWWVFAARNPEVIEDPVNDFSSGKTIRVPKKATVFAALGL
jgi:hypothetical protein